MAAVWPFIHSAVRKTGQTACRDLARRKKQEEGRNASGRSETGDSTRSAEIPRLSRTETRGMCPARRWGECKLGEKIGVSRRAGRLIPSCLPVKDNWPLFSSRNSRRARPDRRFREILSLAYPRSLARSLCHRLLSARPPDARTISLSAPFQLRPTHY